MREDKAGLQSVVAQQEEAYEQRKKSWLPDVRNTPCARSALIHGILGGLTLGLLYFAKSSIVRRSCDLAVGGFAVMALTSWEVCRWSKAKKRAEVKRTVAVLNTLTSRTTTDDTSQADTIRSKTL
ncbi:cytochrome c oxidase assembly protein COX20, mitochondrial-like [Halichondria panicea]|uniref:cytochrome c oxidase assembly protein COX20, mitochondrial-like n=1 Tax=Halichondria panicea TaxID=6063 RepID=UPI00312B2C00